MAKYPAQLQSANLNEFGIVYADEVQGHKTVATLSALYAITDPILSKSVVNTGNDAIGQEWYVISEGCYYRLDNWANRHKASGWTKIQVVDTEFNSLSTHGADKIKISRHLLAQLLSTIIRGDLRLLMKMEPL